MRSLEERLIAETGHIWGEAGEPFGGAVVGLEVAVVVGLIAPKSPDLVYRR